ncbi:unnamed protein product [Mytilus coruscus]|uniref:Uncharacterized protein n=1 Tax=Mytilus coruscus TaxID=42192 RepID=A0A6J8CU58_MYTCO|nr:unnamed protein product [Mytilus coruscus]
MNDLKDQMKTLTSMLADITVQNNSSNQTPNYRRQHYRQSPTHPPRQQHSLKCYGCRGKGHIHIGQELDLSTHQPHITESSSNSLSESSWSTDNELITDTAKVNWFQELSDNVRHCYGKPIEVWSSDLYVRDGPAIFIPVQKIKCRFVHAKIKVGHRNRKICSRGVPDSAFVVSLKITDVSSSVHQQPFPQRRKSEILCKCT